MTQTVNSHQTVDGPIAHQQNEDHLGRRLRREVDGNLSVEPNPMLESLLPEENKQACDVRAVIEQIVDSGDFLKVQSGHAMNIVVGFASICGGSVGIIGNQPSVMAGALDIKASNKAARDTRFCNAFNIPLVALVDVPGFMPGVEQEYGDVIRHGAKQLFAYAAATAPQIVVILRKSYGGSYLAMCGKDLDADRVFAWPTAEIAVMGAEGAAEIVFRHGINEAADPEHSRAELIKEYRDTFSNPYVAAELRLLDSVIEPAHTRRHIAHALEYLRIQRVPRPHRKHGLMPL